MLSSLAYCRSWWLGTAFLGRRLFLSCFWLGAFILVCFSKNFSAHHFSSILSVGLSVMSSAAEAKLSYFGAAVSPYATAAPLSIVSPSYATFLENYNITAMSCAKRYCLLQNGASDFLFSAAYRFGLHPSRSSLLFLASGDLFHFGSYIESFVRR